MVLDFLREIFMKFFKVFTEFFLIYMVVFVFRRLDHTYRKNVFFKNENDMQILQNIYNNMMAYGAMNHCLLFGWRRNFGFFMNFFISIYFFCHRKRSLIFAITTICFTYVNAIAYSLLKMSCFFKR